MLQKTRAIALHGVRFGEKSLVASLYTLDFGRVSIMVNQAYGGKLGRNKAIYFQPLSLIDLVFYQGRNHGMGRLKEVSLYASTSFIQQSVTKSAIALFIGEIIYRLVREVESNPTLFVYLEHSIQILECLSEGVQNFHVIFLAQLTRYLGFYPSGVYSTSTPFFDMKSGLFVADQPSHGLFLDNEQSNFLSQALNINFSESKLLKMNGVQRSELMNSFINYFSFHTDTPLGVKSLSVLKQVFND